MKKRPILDPILYNLLQVYTQTFFMPSQKRGKTTRNDIEKDLAGLNRKNPKFLEEKIFPTIKNWQRPEKDSENLTLNHIESITAAKQTQFYLEQLERTLTETDQRNTYRYTLKKLNSIYRTIQANEVVRKVDGILNDYKNRLHETFYSTLYTLTSEMLVIADNPEKFASTLVETLSKENDTTQEQAILALKDYFTERTNIAYHNAKIMIQNNQQLNSLEKENILSKNKIEIFNYANLTIPVEEQKLRLNTKNNSQGQLLFEINKILNTTKENQQTFLDKTNLAEREYHRTFYKGKK